MLFRTTEQIVGKTLFDDKFDLHLWLIIYVKLARYFDNIDGI